jgi:hypothetical protein
LGLEFLNSLSQQKGGDVSLVSVFLQLDSLKTIIENDKLKEPGRIISLVSDIFLYFAQTTNNLGQIGQRLTQELETLDLNWLRMYKLKQKCTRRRKRVPTQVNYPIHYDLDKMNESVTSHDFYDYFLMKYAIFMTIGDLILSTNVSYIDNIPNLIPYSRSNKLSTISMIAHIYDGTSYGLSKNYESITKGVIDLRREFL